MPYGRRNYRSRRYRRRNALSNYNIATRTSARSQANQIYRLKRRIRNIEARTKPEIQLFRTPAVTYTSPSASQSQNGSQVAVYRPFSNEFTIDGKFARLQDLTAYLTIRTYPGTGTGVSPSAPQLTVRVVMIQTKATRDTPINFNDVFYGSELETNDTTALANTTALEYLSAPFADGLARVGKVYYDRRYTVTNDYPLKVTKMKFKRLLNYYTAEGETIPKGDINLFVLIYTPGYSQGGYTVTVSSKLAYTDS